MKLKKNDIVKVITGKYKGQKGRVIKIIKDKNRVVVEGINNVKKHTKPSQENPQGGIIEKEASIHCSNVLFMEKDIPIRIGYKLLDNGKKVRFSKKTGNTID